MFILSEMSIELKCGKKYVGTTGNKLFFGAVNVYNLILASNNAS